MEKEILEGQIGQDGKYDLAFRDGKLMVEVMYMVSGVEAKLSISLGSDAILEAIAKAIPGKIDDQVIALIKAALKA